MSQPGELAEYEGKPWHQRAFVSGSAGSGLAGAVGAVSANA
ncbi:hypothetical protein [Streptomyces sp. BH055]